LRANRVNLHEKYDHPRVLAVDPGGATASVADASEEYSRASGSLTVGEGALWSRVPRCAPVVSSNAIAQSTLGNGLLRIDLASTPSLIAHWWTPRGTAVAGKRYVVEARYRVTGQAAIQFGIDYWRTKSAPYAGWDPTCSSSNNCEAWVSGWVGDTGGQFVTRRFPTVR
jgi:hypothetical protein